MQLSCGALIETPKGILLARATGTGRWDIPKGGIERGETPLQAAMRETHEETNINLNSRILNLEDLGEHAYMPRKRLHLFRLRLAESFSLAECKCTAWFDLPNGKRILEMDAFAWVPWSEVQGKVGKSLWAYFNNQNLAPKPERPTP